MAREQGLLSCTVEAACLIRRIMTNEVMAKMDLRKIVAMTSPPMYGVNQFPYLLCVRRKGNNTGGQDTACFDMVMGKPTTCYKRNEGFAFLLPEKDSATASGSSSGRKKRARGSGTITMAASSSASDVIKCISSGNRLVVPFSAGIQTIAGERILFDGYFDPDFEDWGTNVSSVSTSETDVEVYELAKDATLAQMFSNPKQMCLTQSQIIDFVRTHRVWLPSKGGEVFFLFRASGNLLIAGISLRTRGRTSAHLYRFEDNHVWCSKYGRRIVLPCFPKP
jgi:hypothetical protein